jgi:ketosteroid isomerase-like protein
MPWFPDFANAAELAREQARAAGRADPVGQYLAALNTHDVAALEDAWPAEVVVYDPRSGEVRGHRQLRRFVEHSRSLLAEHRARVETMTSTVVGNRAVVELLAHIVVDGRSTAWPVAVVAESRGEKSMVFRSYLCLRILDGQHHVRPPILAAGQARARDVVARYGAALAAGDAEAVVRTFASDGYLREAGGPQETHRGTAELRAYFRECFDTGGIVLEECEVTDDGVRCALEYNCVRWGARPLPAQAGIAVFERDADGLLAAVRHYDDVEKPAGGI